MDPVSGAFLNGDLKLGVAGFDRLEAEEISETVRRAVDGIVTEQEARYDRHAPAARAYWMLRSQILSLLEGVDPGDWSIADIRHSVDFAERFREQLAAEQAAGDAARRA